MKPALRALVLVAVVAVAAAYVALGAAHPWDFETYYHAAVAYRAGLNPYDLASLSRVAGHPVELPFLYPPITLVALSPLTYLPLQVAAAIWLAFKVLLVAVLLRLWRRDFLPRVPWGLLLPVTLLGFNLALLWDLRTGNAALVEETLLWLALSAYVRGRKPAFVGLVVLASVFKLYPVLLLGLALEPAGARRGSWKLIGAGLAILLVLVALPLPAAGEWLRAASGSFGRDRPFGAINPSALGLVDWALSASAAPRGLAAWLAPAIYAAYAALLLATSVPVLNRARRSGSPRELALAAVLLWLLLAPRVMVYSYVMAIVPSLAVASERISSRWGREIAVGLLVAQGFVRLLPGRPPEAVGALSFFLVLGAWVIYARGGRASAA